MRNALQPLVCVTLSVFCTGVRAEDEESPKQPMNVVRTVVSALKSQVLDGDQKFVDAVVDPPVKRAAHVGPPRASETPDVNQPPYIDFGSPSDFDSGKPVAPCDE